MLMYSQQCVSSVFHCIQWQAYWYTDSHLIGVGPIGPKCNVTDVATDLVRGFSARMWLFFKLTWVPFPAPGGPSKTALGPLSSTTSFNFGIACGGILLIFLVYSKHRNGPLTGIGMYRKIEGSVAYIHLYRDLAHVVTWLSKPVLLELFINRNCLQKQ